MKKSLLSIAIVTVLVVSSGAALGQVLTSDNFNYVGALTDNGWTAHSGAGNKVVMADGAIATLEQSGGSGEDVNRSFAPQGATDKVYAGFDLWVDTADLFRLDGNGLYLAHFKDSGFAFRGRTGVVQGPGGQGWGLAINADSSNLGAGATWPSDLMFDTWHRVVISWDAASGTSELWLNPTIETDPKITHTGGNSGDLIEAFALRQSNDYTGFQRVDNVVVGLTFGDVVAVCRWDLDDSGDVGVKDLLILLGEWGPCADCNDCIADLDDDCTVGVKDLLILLGNWGPCQVDPPKLVYSHEFVNGVTYCPGDPQYDDWLSYRASLPTSGVMSITVSGSQDPTGRTCSDAFIAQLIAGAMRTQTPFTAECGGFTWTVGGLTCQAGCALPDNGLLLSADGDSCNCISTYTIRPGIGNENWGGITGGSCGSPTQIMTVTIQ